MSIPSDFDPLVWGERRYIQPVIKGNFNNGSTDESHPFSFKMSVSGTSTNGAWVPNAFDGKGSGWGAYGGASPSCYALITFEHPLKIVGVQFINGFNAHPRYYDFYGVEDDGTEVLLWHTQRGYGTFTDNMRCKNPRYFKRYKFVQSFDEGWGGWACVYWVKLDALYRPADL